MTLVVGDSALKINLKKLSQKNFTFFKVIFFSPRLPQCDEKSPIVTPQNIKK